MKIVLALDPSKASQVVLEEAVARPWPAGTSFAIVHVVDLQPLAGLPVLIQDAKRAGEDLVNSASERLSRAGYKSTSEVFLGSPRAAIAEFAKRCGADLILAGSHGQGAIARLLLGSVAQGILRIAPCSVEIVRPGPQGEPGPPRGMRILLATDGSDCSIAAVKSIASRPWPAGSQIKILSVVELVVLTNQISVSSLSAVYPPSLLEELMNNARSRAKEAVDNARKAFAEAGLQVVENGSTPLGDPRVVILDQAKDWAADLIVLGSHGRRGIDRVLLGSVSESVAMHAHCSVEVIRG